MRAISLLPLLAIPHDGCDLRVPGHLTTSISGAIGILRDAASAACKQAHGSIRIWLDDGALNTTISDHTMISDRHDKHNAEKNENAPIPSVRRIPIDY